MKGKGRGNVRQTMLNMERRQRICTAELGVVPGDAGLYKCTKLCVGLHGPCRQDPGTEPTKLPWSHNCDWPSGMWRDRLPGSW